MLFLPPWSLIFARIEDDGDTAFRKILALRLHQISHEFRIIKVLRGLRGVSGDSVTRVHHCSTEWQVFPNCSSEGRCLSISGFLPISFLWVCIWPGGVWPIHPPCSRVGRYFSFAILFSPICLSSIPCFELINQEKNCYWSIEWSIEHTHWATKISVTRAWHYGFGTYVTAATWGWGPLDRARAVRRDVSGSHSHAMLIDSKHTKTCCIYGYARASVDDEQKPINFYYHFL